MLADFFTKPLQGHLFQKFRDVIMGYKPIFSLKWTSFEIKERVGFYRNQESWFQNILNFVLLKYEPNIIIYKLTKYVRELEENTEKKIREYGREG